MIRMFVVAIISAIVSAPLALSIQYLIMNVLSKPSGEKGKESVSVDVTRKVERERGRGSVHVRVNPSSPFSSDLVERCGRTLLEDLNNLLGELFAYYTSLLAQGSEEDEAKEFRSKFPIISDCLTSNEICFCCHC